MNLVKNSSQKNCKHSFFSSKTSFSRGNKFAVANRQRQAFELPIRVNQKSKEKHKKNSLKFHFPLYEYILLTILQWLNPSCFRKIAEKKLSLKLPLFLYNGKMPVLSWFCFFYSSIITLIKKKEILRKSWNLPFQCICIYVLCVTCLYA